VYQNSPLVLPIMKKGLKEAVFYSIYETSNIPINLHNHETPQSTSALSIQRGTIQQPNHHSTSPPQTHPNPPQSHALPTTSPIPVKKKKKSPSAETRGFQPSRPPSCGRKLLPPSCSPEKCGGGSYSYSYISLRLGRVPV